MKKKTKAQIRYLLYLKSDWWQSRRLIAFEKNGRKCERCGTDKRLSVHHKTYRNLGKELDSDLEILCSGCHSAHHDITKPKRRCKTKPPKDKKRILCKVPGKRPKCFPKKAWKEFLASPNSKNLPEWQKVYGEFLVSREKRKEVKREKYNKHRRERRARNRERIANQEESVDAEFLRLAKIF